MKPKEWSRFTQNRDVPRNMTSFFFALSAFFRGKFQICLAGFTLALAAAPDPDLPPGRNFDLSHWKVTLPDADASEIGPDQLQAGFTNEFFHTGPDGAMIFWCPVTGGVTRLAIYPRCELRELMDPDNQSRNWTGYGTNILNAQCRVTQIPSSGRVIIGQIHSFTGNAYP